MAALAPVANIDELESEAGIVVDSVRVLLDEEVEVLSALDEGSEGAYSR